MGLVLRGMRRHCGIMRLLVLCNVVPYPPHGGVHTRVFNIIQRVARRHDVTLGCHSWGEEDEAGAAWLTRNGIRTVTAPVHAANWRHAMPAVRAILAGLPPEISQYQTRELHALVARERFDVLQIEETLLAPYATSLPRHGDTRTLLVLHNVHFVQEQRIAALETRRRDRLWRRLNATMMRRYEPAVAARFDRLISVSDADRALLRDATAGLTIDVLPNGVDAGALRPLPEPVQRRGIVFVGTLNYRPCIDAVLWLVAAIMPILRRHLPDLELWIVGKQPPPEVLALAGAGIFVTGYVADVTPYYLRNAVAVVPIRAGGGSRLKILEAMAFGRPVVSTTIGAEGLDVTHRKDIIVADDAESFAAGVLHLLTGATLTGEAPTPAPWRAIASNARQFVAARHDWDAIAARQLEIYDALLEPR
jgi:glycosyltransferase involved in cell wall biosynthesis